jgi:hypothetical protein
MTRTLKESIWRHLLPPKDILVEREKFMKETVGGLPIYSD